LSLCIVVVAVAVTAADDAAVGVSVTVGIGIGGGVTVARAALVARALATTSVYDNRLRTASTSSRRGHFNYKFLQRAREAFK